MRFLQFLLWYAEASAALGFGYTVVSIWKHRKIFFSEEYDKQDSEEVLQKYVDRGHLQKAVYGKRTVYHENTLEGEIAVWADNAVTLFKHRRPWVYVSLVVVINVIDMAIAWPKYLYDSLTGNTLDDI